MSESAKTAAQYDAMAQEYSVANDDGIYNALYERPAMLAALGDVTDKRVLDAGCGAGQLCAALIERGANVTGIDVSSAMVELATTRLEGEATIQVADLTTPLPFESGSFDLVVASLVMHYIEDWVGVLSEMRRVLTPAGTVALSTHHPTMDWRLHSPDNYFELKQVTDTWNKGGAMFDVTYWRRPLSAMSNDFVESGFRIATLDEPMPLASLGDRDPEQYDYLRTHPHFLVITLVPTRS